MVQSDDFDAQVREIVSRYSGPIQKVRTGARGISAATTRGNQGAGRPAKAGERYPSGQLKPTQSPALLRRIFKDAEEGYLDARLGSHIGRLLFHRQLSYSEASIAFQIGEVYGRYEAQIGKRRTTRSPSYESGFGGDLRPEWVDDELRERVAAIKEQWLALQDEIETYGRQARQMIEALCVNDEPINSLHLADVRRILARLAMFFRSRRSKKRRKRTAPLNVAMAMPAPAAQLEVPRRIDHEREAWLSVQRKLSPHLKERELSVAYEIFQAMKERAAFNNKKPRHPALTLVR